MKISFIATLLAIVALTDSLPAKGKTKIKKLKHEIRKKAAEAVAINGPHSPALGPSKLYSPGSLCTESHAQYIGKKNGFPRCKSSLIRKQKRIISNNYGVEEMDWGSYTFMHVIPLELGGSDDIDNSFIAPKSSEEFKKVSQAGHDAYKALLRNEMTLFEAIKNVFDVLNSEYKLSGKSAYYISSIVSDSSLQARVKKGRKSDVSVEDLHAIRVKEDATRDMDTKIGEDNIGYQFLIKAGWIPGESLGDGINGIKTPILPKHRKPDCKDGIGYKRLKSDRYSRKKMENLCSLSLSDFFTLGRGHEKKLIEDDLNVGIDQLIDNFENQIIRDEDSESEFSIESLAEDKHISNEGN